MRNHTHSGGLASASIGIAGLLAATALSTFKQHENARARTDGNQPDTPDIGIGYDLASRLAIGASSAKVNTTHDDASGTGQTLQPIGRSFLTLVANDGASAAINGSSSDISTEIHDPVTDSNPLGLRHTAGARSPINHHLANTSRRHDDSARRTSTAPRHRHVTSLHSRGGSGDTSILSAGASVIDSKSPAYANCAGYC